jgi:hypothetical protein
MPYSDKKSKEINDYFKQYGTEQTLKTYNIKKSSLDRIMRFCKVNDQMKYDYERIDDEDKVQLSLKSYELKTIDELLAYSKIDTTLWEVWKVISNSWGSENNPCFQIKAWLRLRSGTDINIIEVCDNIIERINKYSIPSIIQHKEDKEGYLCEIGIVDHHLGQLSWKQEVGFNYDIKIAKKLHADAVDFLIDKIKPYKINKILYHFGQDFYNVNSQFNHTVAGTRQDEDGRWQKSFEEGIMVHVDAINKLKQIADVDAISIKGNHDEERTQYAATVLKAWFRLDSNVKIDNSPMSRKYYLYGKNLIGLSHAEEIKTDRLLGLMPIEAKEMWSKACHYEWHIGHLHSESLKQSLSESNGIKIRHLSTLVPVDAWHFNKGYLHNRETNLFLWHPEKGNQIQINYKV